MSVLLVLWHAWCRYWDWAGSNVGAMPLCGLLGGLSAVLFRKRLGALWRKHSGADAAEKAHRIAADLFGHHLGRPHPDAPDQDGGAG